MSDDPVSPPSTADISLLDRVAGLIDEARQGHRTEEATLEAITRLVRGSVAPAATYQKPWG